MRKTIARALVLVAALSSLVVAGPAPTASAHHDRGHHCRMNDHKHGKGFFKSKPRPAVARHRHKHHKHECSTYPISAPAAYYTAR